ncbi:MAG: transglutaminaseTgpA domain-containing protein [Phycisphaerales bacterium]
MRAPRNFRLALGAIVTLSMVAFGVAESNLALGGALLVAAMGGWWYTEWSAERRGLQRWATNLILMGVLIGAFVRAAQGGAMVSAFNAFLASLIAVKLWERREVRDYAQVLTLSLFLAVGATLNHNSLGVGLSLLILAPLLSYAAMMFQVIAGEARVRHESEPAESSRAAGPGPAEGAMKLGMLSINAALIAGLISIGVFLLIPRGIAPPSGMSSFGLLMSGRVTGITDQVRLGQGGLISESQAVALHVKISDAAGQVIGGEGQIQYLRGAVLDQYRDGTWSRNPALEESSHVVLVDDVAMFTMGSPTREWSRSRFLQEFQLRAVAPRDAQLFSLYRPVEVREDPRPDAGPDASRGRLRYRFSRDTGWISRSGPAGPLAYRVYSMADDASGSAASNRGRVEFPSRRLSEKAAEILAAAGVDPDPFKRDPADDNMAARVLESFLRKECSYTLDIRAAPAGVDPTEWFVFTERRGHCEYFASALAGMCRSIGIDARVVAGYVATQFDPDLQAYVVRASNAHAWVEANISGGVWRTFDATPPADFDRLHGPPQSVLLRLSRMFGDLEDVWASRVVSFDQTTQARLFGPQTRGLVTRDWLAAAWSWMRGLAGGASIRSSGPVVLIVAFYIIASIAVAVVVARRRRARRGAPKAPTLQPSLLKLRAELLDLCTRVEMPRPMGATLHRHATQVAAAHPEISTEVLAAAALIYRGCFAAEEIDPAPAADLARRLRGYR